MPRQTKPMLRTSAIQVECAHQAAHSSHTPSDPAAAAALSSAGPSAAAEPPADAPDRCLDCGDGKGGGYEALLYLIFGLGSGWTLVDATMIEVARMGQVQPEGLALATALGTAGTIGSTAVVPLFYAFQRQLRWPLGRWVWLALAGQMGAAVLGAAAWRVTWGGTSAALYAVSFLSTFSGNFQQLAVVPWVQEGGTDSAAVSWTMAGSNFGAVICSLVGFLQMPGSPEQRFSVSVFFAVVATLVGLGAAAYALLRRRRNRHSSRPAAECSASRGEGGRRARQPVAGDGMASMRHVQQSDLILRRASGSRCARWCRRARGCGGFLPWFALHPHVVRVAAVNAILQLVCWIFLRSLMPYAAARAASEDGTAASAQQAHEDGHAGELQALTVEVSLLAVFAGATLSAYVPDRAVRLAPALACELLPLVAISALCAGWRPLGSSTGARAALLVSATVARFADGLFSPLLYRIAGDPFPESERQAVTQWTGVVAIVVSTLGTWVTLGLVAGGVVGGWPESGEEGSGEGSGEPD